ncbi:MAG TPA: S9 family peptidase [Gammaproteobacteria bacterium]
MSRIATLLVCAFFLSSAAASDVVPVEAFARLPALKSPTISPDGKTIAVLLANQDGYYDVAVTEFGSSEFRIVAKMKSPLDRIFSVTWGSNQRLLISAASPENRRSLTFYVSKLYSVDIESNEVIELRPKHFDLDWRDRYSSNGRVISEMLGDPEHVLVQWRGEKDEHASVYKVNIVNGDYEKLFFNDYGVDSWYADSSGNVSLGFEYGEEEEIDDEMGIWVPDPVSDGWKKIKTLRYTRDAMFSPLALSKDGKYLYVLSTHEYDTASLYKFDIAKGEFAEELWHVDGYDITGFVMRGGELMGVSWGEDYEKQHFLDESDQNLDYLVEQTFRGAEVSIASTDANSDRIIVSVIRDDLPRAYYLFDVKAGKVYPWFSQYPELLGVKLAKHEPIQYKSRDGLTIHGYFTRPLNGDVKPPLVVLPHGGPWARDYRYFDFLSQFIASRGYAVIQMNFRGSSGYGATFERMGDKQWGQSMQNDVLDAVAWVKEEGLADTDRMCVVGASYGGYVALTAAVQTPELFDCVVSISGVTDLIEHIEGVTILFGGTQAYNEWIGDPNDPEERQMLEKYSPINHVANLSTPVLLFHGTRDSRVSYEQSDEFHEMARRLRKDVEYIKVKGATHFLDDGLTRLKALQAIEEFLGEHL